MQFTIRAYNSNGVELSLPTEPGRYGQPGATVSDARYFVATWKTGYRNALDQSKRNRVASFRIFAADGTVIADINRDRSNGEADASVRVADAVQAAIEAQSDASARSPLSPQWGPVEAREAASVAQDDMAERIRRGAAWLDTQIPGWRDMIEGEPGYSADQLARIADGADSQGNRAAVPWIQECARVKAERADRFEVNPYWGDTDVYAVTVDNESTGALGVIVYRASDGELLEFTQVERTMTSREAPEQALRSIGYAVRPVNARSLGVSDEEWRYYADETNWPATSGKFQNGLAERLSDTSEFADDTMGDVEGFGHFALFKSDRAMLQTDNFGFVGVTRFDTEALTQTAWESLARDYERHCLAGMEDALPTSECDEVFLIFDTARHRNGTADRDEIIAHVIECEICSAYQCVLDEF